MSKRPILSQSQLITTFGPGAMIDLPTRSVLVGGLDRWRLSGAYKQIDEPALVRLLERGLRKLGRWDKARPLRLLMPPVAARLDGRDPPGVDVTIFPTWFVCDRIDTPMIAGQQRRGRRLIKWSELDPVSDRKRFQHDDGKKDDVSPIRFVGACEKGHLQDIDWRRLVHSGQPCHEPMWLSEEGTSANLADLEIVCGCGQSISLKEVTKPGRLGTCEGRQPWLDASVHEDCRQDEDPTKRTLLRLLTRSATNAYFPQVQSVISLPIEADALVALVERHWASLSKVPAQSYVDMARSFNPPLGDDLRGYTDQEVWDCIQRVKSQETLAADAENPKIAEFDLLASGRATIGSNDPSARLHAQTLPRSAWSVPTYHNIGLIRSIVAVHRLREVVCLYGFTRLEPAPTSSDEELEDLQLAVRGAPLSLNADWLPAIEQFGEGIFIQFDADRIQEWLEREDVKKRIDVLIKGWRAHKKKHPYGESTFVGGQYIMIHSVSHALLTEIALDCGYPASSLKERIYAFGPENGQPARYGVLIYTASTGAQGTLGGLVANAVRVPDILNEALTRLAVCSNDPVCADHEPGTALDERALHGAACHGCLLIAETSCERRNQFLDRGLLVETMADAGSAFFSLPEPGGSIPYEDEESNLTDQDEFIELHQLNDTFPDGAKRIVRIPGKGGAGNELVRFRFGGVSNERPKNGTLVILRHPSLVQIAGATGIGIGKIYCSSQQDMETGKPVTIVTLRGYGETATLRFVEGQMADIIAIITDDAGKD